MPLPDFLRKPIPKLQNLRRLRTAIGDPRLFTVCEEAKCPNLGECYSRGACTFMILGNVCTRSCAFCGISSGQPSPPDPSEPKRIAEAALRLGLKYVVITSVTRDDLTDGGAAHFAETVREIRRQARDTKIELLIPDLKGDFENLARIVDAGPDVINHNLETVARLSPTVRPQADHARSLRLLKRIKELKKQIYSKSGFMVGLGETDGEVIGALEELREADCDIATIGQYLPPSRSSFKPERYVLPDTFAQWKEVGRRMGFTAIEAGPFVRSSYHAGEILKG